MRTYARTAARLKAPLPHDIVAILEDVCGLSRRIAPFRPVLCHNDLLPANLIDAGDRLWLVDWEYGGAGHPLFDLANASANASLTGEQDHALLDAYRGRTDAIDMAELTIFKAVSLLRESLWSTIQTVASDIDFDYPRYAVDNLEAFRARGWLFSEPRKNNRTGCYSRPIRDGFRPLFTAIFRVPHNMEFTKALPGRLIPGREDEILSDRAG